MKLKYRQLVYRVCPVIAGLLFLILLPSAAQNISTDSLKTLLGSMEEDTLKVKSLNAIAAAVHKSDPQEAIRYGTRARELAEKLEYRKGLAEAHKNIGLGYYEASEFTKALEAFDSSLEIYEFIGDDRGVANLLSNLGAIYYNDSRYEAAIEHHLRALRIAEKIEDSTRIGTSLLNIGLVYSEQPSALSRAKEYYLRALDIGEAIDYKALLAFGSINLGEVYFKLQAYDSALYFLEQSLDMLSEPFYRAAALNYMGESYAGKGDYPAALEYHREALELMGENDDVLQKVIILLGTAGTHYKQGDTRSAINFFERARDIAEEIGAYPQLSEIYRGLASAYADRNDFRNAYHFMALQQETDNILYRLETERRTGDVMFSYQLEKKEAEIAILEQQAEIEQLTSRRQRAIILTVALFGILLLVLAIGLYNRMRFVRETNRKINTQKAEIEAQRDQIRQQRDQIQQQHDMVFLQKKLITDSISYAQRIQSALLPSEEILKELMPPEHFIFFRPKDIVSGDFYWVKEVQDHLIMVGADCTGHGVPGAFMSMLGITLLNSMVGERCFDAPSAMLERLRQKIKELLVQEGKSDEQKDGMEMVIAILNKRSRELHFSGANTPLYIIRNKRAPAGDLEPFASLDIDGYQLFELKGDKQPIGTHWEETPFTTRSIKLSEQDTLYIFSDGYVDQYGGENRKKFKSLNFKKLLLALQDRSMEDQKQAIEETFETWKGDLEQIDDVSVIGVRI